MGLIEYIEDKTFPYYKHFPQKTQVVCQRFSFNDKVFFASLERKSKKTKININITFKMRENIFPEQKFMKTLINFHFYYQHSSFFPFSASTVQLCWKFIGMGFEEAWENLCRDCNTTLSGQSPGKSSCLHRPVLWWKLLQSRWYWMPLLSLLI